VGHGAFDESSAEGFLLFEDESGQARPVSGPELGNILADHRPLRLALLNACQGAQVSTSDPYGGAAQKLVQRGIPAVIAMRTSVSDDAAIAFSHEFYAALSDGQPVDAAMSEARRAVSAAGATGEWGTPVLFMRAMDGVLWQRKPLLRLPLPAIAAAATLVLLLLAAVAAGSFFFSGPTVMGGRFNVAVTEIGELDTHGAMQRSEVGQLLSKWVFDELSAADATYEGGSRVLLWHDSLPFTQKRVRLGTIGGRTPQERASAAATLAGRIRADVVIYGHLEDSGAEPQFVLEFYVSPRVRTEANVTIGRYQLGDPIPVPAGFDINDTLAREALASRVGARAGGLFWLLLGLRSDLLGQPEEALTLFQKADTEIKNWRDHGEGKEILYFFIAREALFLKRYPEAEDASRKALASNPGYVRAQLVLGGVHLAQAQELSPAGRLAEPHDLDQAIQVYAAALDTARQTGEPLLEAIARLALAMAYRVQGETLSNLQRDAEANEWFDRAIQEVKPVLDPLSEAGQYRLLAQAYTSWGTAAMEQAQVRQLHGDLPTANRLYRDAQTAFAGCITQGGKAPEDEILQSQIIGSNCLPLSKTVEEILRRLEGVNRG
jgi:tetratricopeptide (TPR) repeat protein